MIKYIFPHHPIINDNVLVVSLIEFNNGHSHIGVYDRCYVLVHRDKISLSLFREAIEKIKSLPSDPSNHQDYVDFLKNGSIKLVKDV